jgi:UDP-glucose 4-epimerase
MSTDPSYWTARDAVEDCMRVLITGMGGELGTRVAQLLELRREVTEIVGVDFVPPRRRLRRSEFRRIDPRDREKLAAFVGEFAPEAIAHVGVYEPASRLPEKLAAQYTHAAAVGALGAAGRTGKLERVVIRSGISVYGRGRGRPGVPDEDAPVAPTTPFGRTLLALEALAADIGRRHEIPVAALRMAAIAGSHMPSPLGRVLRLPAVPVPALADPVFQLLHADDAAQSMVRALMAGFDGPLNIVGPGAASVWQAVRLGGRIPVPIAGPMWSLAAQAVELAGAPAPPHVIEILTKGGAADGSRAVEALELPSLRSTHEVCTELFEWATVTPLRPEVALGEASRG